MASHDLSMPLAFHAMTSFRLTSEIIDLSEAGTWENAVREWMLEEVYLSEEPDTCLCGHFPIVEVCVLRNKKNRNTAIVGNCCVKKFLGLPSDKIFQAVKRVSKDSDKLLNPESIQHALDRGWINEWEQEFYLDIMKKRKLTPKQAAKKEQINNKFLRNMERKR